MTTIKTTFQVAALSLVMTGAAAVAGAQTPAPRPNGPAPAQDRYVVGQAKPPEVPGTAIMNLSLEDAIQRALDRNIELKVARYNPQLTDYQIQATKAFYRPNFANTTRYQDSTSLTSSSVDVVPSVSSRNLSANTSVNQQLPFNGMSYNGSFNTNRLTSTNPTSTRPLSFGSSLSFNVTQPLLQNFKTDSTRTTLRTQQITREINDIQLKALSANTIASVRAAYWDLRAAIENIEIQRRAVDLGRSLVDQNRIKVEVGTMAQIDVITAESQQANAELNLVNAESTWRQAEQNLKRLIAGGTDDDIYRSTINPTEAPSMAAPNVDIAAAVAAALAQRTDLLQARKQLDSALLTIDLLKNQVLPQLNMSAGYSVAGSGGNLFTPENRGVLGSPMLLVSEAGYINSISGAFDQPTWNIQATVNYPLGQTAARANLARTRLTFEQSQTSLKATELSVSSEVTNAGLQVQNTYKALMAAQKARELAERQADAEQTKFEVGMSTNFTVVQQQQAMTSARTAELRAILNYIKALVEFERVQSTGR